MKLSNIDLRLLRVFAAVVQSGGFTPAADALNLGRPTISTHMADLEQRLGMRLCDRGRSGFALTEHGEQVYERVQQLLTAIEDFNADMDSIHGHLTGELNLGQIDYMTSVPYFCMSNVLQKFSDQAPDVKINLQVLAHAELSRGVIDGRFHMAIISSTQPLKDLEVHPFMDEKLYMYCSSAHPLYSRPDTSLSTQDLANARACGPSWKTDPLRKLRPRPGNDANANNLEATLMLILSGRYVGYLPDHFARPWVELGDLRALKPDITCVYHELPIVTRNNGRKSPQLQAFMSLLFSEHAKLVAE